MSSRSVVSIALAFACATFVCAARLLASPGGTIPHVRCSDREMLRLLREGLRRSATLRQLVDELQHTDVIVYVESEGAFLGPPVKAHLRLAGATSVMRYVRVAVKIPTATDTAIALIGHELRHATEVARAAEVRDQQTLEALYRRIGEENEAGWETRAACQTGDLIREELHRGNARPANADNDAPATAAALLKSVTKRR